ncbi:MAG: hypothetical protein GEU78_16320 [Actinobacteria bacterium]|nr:hypothetical protein [Actinomycetota bacterium]
MDSFRLFLGGGRRGVVVAAVALFGLVGALFVPVPAGAVVAASDADLEIIRREVVADGHRFGRTGAYEKLVGTIAFEVDPDDPRNAVIVDLDKAPRNERGMVEYDTDFYLLRPVNMRRWNGKLFFEVNNRGNKITSLIGGPSGNDPTTQEDFSPGFLLNEGWAVAWAGWEGDVLAGNDRMTIRLPVPTEEARSRRRSWWSSTTGTSARAVRWSACRSAGRRRSRATRQTRSPWTRPPCGRAPATRRGRRRARFLRVTLCQPTRGTSLAIPRSVWTAGLTRPCGRPRVFRTVANRGFYAATCTFRYSSWTSCGVR